MPRLSLTLLSITLIVIAFSLYLSLIFRTSTFPTPTNSPQPQTISTTTWKTYTNTIFSFSYPPNWTYHPGIDSPAWGTSNEKDSSFSISFSEDPECRRQKDYTLKHRTTLKQLTTSTTLIDNFPATLIEGKAEFTGYEDNRDRKLDYKIVLLSKDQLCYDLSTQAHTGATRQSKQFLDQILSTFQFVN